MSRPDSFLATYCAGRLRSFAHALAGLAFMWRTQPNARIQLAAAALAAAAGLVLRISAADWRWLVLAIALVWLTEAVNTAIEHLCDVVSPERRDSVRLAKDIAAGAVLISAVAALLIGALVLLPYVLHRL